MDWAYKILEFSKKSLEYSNTLSWFVPDTSRSEQAESRATRRSDSGRPAQQSILQIPRRVAYSLEFRYRALRAAARDRCSGRRSEGDTRATLAWGRFRLTATISWITPWTLGFAVGGRARPRGGVAGGERGGARDRRTRPRGQRMRAGRKEGIFYFNIF
jgi:hypothetical protein